MKINAFVMLAVAASAFCSCSSEGGSPDEVREVPGLQICPVLETTRTISLSAPEEAANASLNRFSFDFLGKAAENPLMFEKKDGNIAVSPVSASMCLAMLANSGDTELETAIARMLGEDNLPHLNETCGKLMRYLPSTSNGAILNLANSVWYNTLYSPTEAWGNGLATNFGASVYGIEFADRNVPLINGWCSDNTNGRIPTIIEKLDPNSIAHLINAFYFQGKWLSDFDPSLTDTQPFDGLDGKKDVRMMHNTLTLDYNRNEEFENVTVPFFGSSRIVFVLPAEGKSATELAAGFTYEKWRDALAGSGRAKVNLSLPKYKIETSADVTEIFAALGMPGSFAMEKMGIRMQNGDIAAGCVLIRQKTSASIDETGAEAAAITDAEIDLFAPDGGKQEELKEVNLTFNRPFLYFIENDRTGTILLAGVVNNI